MLKEFVLKNSVFSSYLPKKQRFRGLIYVVSKKMNYI